MVNVMRASQIHKQSQANKTRLQLAMLVLLLGVVTYVASQNWQTVEDSLEVATSAKISWLLGAAVVMLCTYIVAAAIYGKLAFKRLLLRQTLLIEVATSFVNRLLPSGVGGLGLHGVYLYKKKHSLPDATAIVTVNNVIGIVAHLSLLFGLLLVKPNTVNELKTRSILFPWQFAVAILIVLIGAGCVPFIRRKVTVVVRALGSSLRIFRLRQLITAYLLAVLLTVLYTAMLYSAARAVDIHLSILQMFIVFSAGMLASTATPTPGGLVGAEAGLFAGFVAYGITAPSAGAAVLLYRLVSYWLPILPGIIALYIAKRQKLV